MKNRQVVDYSYELNRFRKYIKPLRLVLGFSDSEMANMIGISRTTYSRFERYPNYIPVWLYLAFRCVYQDVILINNDYDFYDEFWGCMIEGINLDNSEFKEEDSDLIASEIFRIIEDRKKCPNRYGASHAHRMVMKELFNMDRPL